MRFLTIFLIFISISSFAQVKSKTSPKLVVGIVVDQMRNDYLQRYEKRFGEGGFAKLMNEGFYNRNLHYNYIPTYTGPGHASIYTGTTPAVHGIVANDWYQRSTETMVNCVEDSAFVGVGGSIEEGRVSPKRLLASTITDELKLNCKNSCKVIGISLKDRGASLPAGHLADGAYWFDDKEGTFMTSSYYMETLPTWVSNFNNKKLPSLYSEKTWNTLYPIETYTASNPDDSKYEMIVKGKEKAVFPYDLKVLKKNYNFGLIGYTPFGNTLLTDLAIAAMEGENLGKDETTDFLAISYSSPDIAGHAFGPRSVEIEDMYLRLDQELARLIAYLEKNVGKDNFVLFLTADHGAAEIPEFLQDHQISAGTYNSRKLRDEMNKTLSLKYGEGNWVPTFMNGQVYFNHKLILEKKLILEDISTEIGTFLRTVSGVTEVLNSSVFHKNQFSEGQRGLLQKGYLQKRSGDILCIFDPGFTYELTHGTTHGTGYTYDTHVPLLWYGWNIPKGSSAKYQEITDIAPTLSFLLNLRLPNGANGKVIEEIVK